MDEDGHWHMPACVVLDVCLCEAFENLDLSGEMDLVVYREAPKLKPSDVGVLEGRVDLF